MALVIGGNVGESLLPPLVGLLIKRVGAESFPIATLLISSMMICSYIAVHFMLINREHHVEEAAAVRRRNSSAAKYGSIPIAGHMSPDAIMLTHRHAQRSFSTASQAMHLRSREDYGIASGTLSPVQRILLTSGTARAMRTRAQTTWSRLDSSDRDTAPINHSSHNQTWERTDISSIRSSPNLPPPAPVQRQSQPANGTQRV